jgi:amidase
VSRTVLDTAVALDAMSGYEAGDATWAPPGDIPFTHAVQRDPGHLRIHVVTDNPLSGPLAPEHQAALTATADALAELGHEVDTPTVEMPGEETLPLFLTVFGANIALSVAHAQLLAGREAGDGDIEPLSRAMWDKAQATSSTEYLIAVALLQSISRRVVSLWADCDVMLTPALAERPLELGTLVGANGMDAFDRAVRFAPYAGLFNATGQPAIVVPAGIADDGLPVAVQLVGRPLAEDTLLQVARQLEVARPWADARPPLG